MAHYGAKVRPRLQVASDGRNQTVPVRAQVKPHHFPCCVTLGVPASNIAELETLGWLQWRALPCSRRGVPDSDTPGHPGCWLPAPHASICLASLGTCRGRLTHLSLHCNYLELHKEGTNPESNHVGRQVCCTTVTMRASMDQSARHHTVSEPAVAGCVRAVAARRRLPLLRAPANRCFPSAN